MQRTEPRWADLTAELDDLQRQERRRSLRSWTPGKPGHVILDGQELLDLASNDYLGLARQEWTTERAAHVLDARGLDGHEQQDLLASLARFGAGASRLITGNGEAHERLEHELASLKGTQAALVFHSGYAANVGTISALVGRSDAIFSDQLNHASIIDGAILSGASRHVYRHRDLNHLEELLRASTARRKLIITDALFSMDGTLAPLRELVQLKQRYGAWLMVDEAHTGGVYGPHGAGLAHHLGVHGDVDVLMGTLSKAYGSIGAYIAGDRVLVDYLINKARSFIFTTGLPPATATVSLLNVLEARGMNGQRERLHEHAGHFRRALETWGFDTGGSESHVVPLVVGDDELAVRAAHAMQAHGIAAVAIRPPSVPRNSARIRFALSGVHETSDVETSLNVIRHVMTGVTRNTTVII